MNEEGADDGRYGGTLMPWRPPGGWKGLHEVPDCEILPAGKGPIDLVVDLQEEVEACDLVALGRAAELTGGPIRLFEPDESQKGKPWYDRLGRLTAIVPAYELNGRRVFIERPQPRENDEHVPLDGQVDAIWLDYVIYWPGRPPEQEESVGTVRTDFAVLDDSTTDVAAACVIVTRDSPLSSHGLVELVVAALLDGPGRNGDGDIDEQAFRREAEMLATGLLLEGDAAIEAKIECAIRDHVRHLMPTDRRTTIEYVPGTGVRVTLGD